MNFSHTSLMAMSSPAVPSRGKSTRAGKPRFDRSYILSNFRKKWPVPAPVPKPKLRTETQRVDETNCGMSKHISEKDGSTKPEDQRNLEKHHKTTEPINHHSLQDPQITPHDDRTVHPNIVLVETL